MKDIDQAVAGFQIKLKSYVPKKEVIFYNSLEYFIFLEISSHHCNFVVNIYYNAQKNFFMSPKYINFITLHALLEKF